MKTWKIPVAVAQQFAANDYVSACTLQIKCDCTLPNNARYVWLSDDNTVDFNGDGTIEGSNSGFRACDALHNAKTDTKFFYHDFTIGKTKEFDDVTFDAPVKLALWREMDEAGNVIDVHITDPVNVANAESNKS